MVAASFFLKSRHLFSDKVLANRGGLMNSQEVGTTNKELIETIDSFFTTVIVATLLCALAACGSKDSSMAAPSSCTITPVFSKASTSSGAYDVLTYSAALPNDCAKLVADRSGGFYFRLDAAATPSTASLTGLNFGGSRQLSYGDTNAHPFSSGGVTVEYTYQTKNYSSPGTQTDWLLPWNDPPTTISATVQLPAGSATQMYPTTMTVTFKSTDQ